MNIGENKENLNNNSFQAEAGETASAENRSETGELRNENIVQAGQPFYLEPVYPLRSDAGNPQANSQAASPKKKRDPVKWIAVGIAAVFAATTVLSASAANRVKLSGSALSGTVSSVSRNSITITIDESSGVNGFFGMPGNMQGGNFEGSRQGTPPDTGSGQNENRTDNSAESDDSETESGGGRQFEGNGAPDMRQMPNKNSDMNGEFDKSQKGESSGKITLKLSLFTTITNGSEKISVSDIEQGDTVTITFGALNSVKSVTLCESDNNGGSFGGMQGNAAQGTLPGMQSGNSESSANQNSENSSDSGSQS